MLATLDVIILDSTRLPFCLHLPVNLLIRKIQGLHLASRMIYTANRLFLQNRFYKELCVFVKTYTTSVEYVQGQTPKKNLREYFYYIDHQGMLFLDDSRMKNFTSCFKDKEFLVFFFKRIRPNLTSRYEDSFPYVSLCGRERNYIRCDDVPIVYTHVIEKDGKDYFCYGQAGDLMHNEFTPEKLYMSPDTGRVYHPCHESCGLVGLVASKLAIEFSKSFLFENGENNPPTHFTWRNNLHTLDTDWFFANYKILKKDAR